MLSLLLRPKIIAGVVALVAIGSLFGWARYERSQRLDAEKQVTLLEQVRDELAARLVEAKALLTSTVDAHNREVAALQAEGERIQAEADKAIAKAAKTRARYMALAAKYGGPVRPLDTDAMARIAAEEARNGEFIVAFQE